MASTPRFDDLHLSQDLLDHLVTIKFDNPTEIQIKAIPLILTGHNVVACAQTGTGKTASFALPLLDILQTNRARARMPRSLILVPTRELAQQVTGAFEILGKTRKINLATLIGGESIVDQEKTLNRGVDVLIATPGRFLDLIERGKVILSDLKCLVLDEADRMLDMGFIPDIEKIMSKLPSSRQTLLFSATLPAPIQRLVQKFLGDHKEIFIAPQSTMATNVEQLWLNVAKEDKMKAMFWLFENENIQSAFVFCNRKLDVAQLQQALKRKGIEALPLHGDMTQVKRQEALAAFREGKATILVASDIAARGLDITGISHVINYDVPINPEDYVHRIGRTGRAGNSGRAITLVTPYDQKMMRQLVDLAKGKLQEVIWQNIGSAEANTKSVKVQDASYVSAKKPRQGAKKASTYSPKTENKRSPLREAAPHKGVPPIMSDISPSKKEAEESIIATVVEKVLTSSPFKQRSDRQIEGSRNEAVSGSERRYSKPQRSDSLFRSNERDDYSSLDQENVKGFGKNAPAFFKNYVSSLKNILQDSEKKEEVVGEEATPKKSRRRKSSSPKK